MHVGDSETSEGRNLGDVVVTVLSEDLKHGSHKLPTVPCREHMDAKVEGSLSDLNCSNLDTI